MGKDAVYTQAVEYDSALKTKEILTPATWMNLKDIMVREIIQPRKGEYCPIPLL